MKKWTVVAAAALLVSGFAFAKSEIMERSSVDVIKRSITLDATQVEECLNNIREAKDGTYEAVGVSCQVELSFPINEVKGVQSDNGYELAKKTGSPIYLSYRSNYTSHSVRVGVIHNDSSLTDSEIKKMREILKSNLKAGMSFEIEYFTW